MDSRTDLEWHDLNVNEATLDYRDVFNTIFSSDLIGVAFTDCDGNILSANEKFARHLGKQQRINLFKLVEGLQPKMVNATLLEYRVHTTAGHLNLCRRMQIHETPDDTYLWFSSQPGGHTEKYMAGAKDMYYSFIGNTFELVFCTTMTDEIHFSNPLFRQSFGLDNRRDDEAISIESLFDDKDDYHLLKERTLVEKRLANERVRFRRADGSLFTGQVNCLLHHTESGEPVVNWTLLDVSQQYQDEQNLKAKNQALAKINGQMEKLLYSASHDLRSPLTSIFGLANLLRIDSADPLVRDYALKIEQCTARLDNIMQGIMNFSKTTYQQVSSELVDFEKVLWKLINVQYSDPNFRKIHFEVHVESRTAFYSDLKRVEIMLDNLIHNALVFVDDTKVKPFVRVHVVVEREEARLEIIDNGIGIAAHHLDNVFAMFYRASDKSRGAGLGLYIVKESINRLNARIRVESEIGFGSVFHLVIPNDLASRT